MKSRPSQRGAQPGPLAPSLPYSGGEADAFIRDLLERNSIEARHSRGTMGTVLDPLDGGIVVQLDDEKAPRTISMSRALGVSYAKGDRVKLSLLRNDEYVIDGIYSDRATDRKVGEGQLAQDSVTNTQIRDGNVFWASLSATVQQQITMVRKWIVRSEDIGVGAVQAGHIDSGAVDWYHLKGDWNKKDTLKGDVFQLVMYAKGKGWIP